MSCKVGKSGSSEYALDPQSYSPVKTGLSGNFLSCSKGVKDPVEFPEVRCDYLPDALGEMGLISPGGENHLNFLSLREVLSSSDWDIRYTICWPQERPAPM